MPGPAGPAPRRYAAAVTQEECVAREERSLIDRAYGGSAGRLVASFVRSGALTAQEREQLRQVFAYPVHAAVIGTAITRPREITRRFVEAAGAQEGQYGA